VKNEEWKVESEEWKVKSEAEGGISISKNDLVIGTLNHLAY